MSLPEFDEFGNLPPGEHAASWSEFQTRYGHNPVRAALLERIREWLTHMKAAGCRTVHIDGSFICANERPADYDASFDHTGVDPTMIEPCLLNRTGPGRLAIKSRFGGDIRPDMVCPPGSIRTYLQFFQRDRDGRPKGVVRIDLRKFQP